MMADPSTSLPRWPMSRHRGATGLHDRFCLDRDPEHVERTRPGRVVDLAAEFTNLILAPRGFLANS